MAVNILIVEADPIFRDNLAVRLSHEDRQILQANPVAETRKLIKRHPIDVVLLGLTSLKEDGLTILKMIKKVRPLIEVITLNGSGQVGLSIAGMKLGAFDDFLGPLALDVLAGRIHEAWLHKRQQEAKAKPLLRRCLDLMSAGAFAEVGEYGMALEYLEEQEASALQERKNRETGNERD